MMQTAVAAGDPAEVGREVRSARERGLSIGFVPTMGALHEGHAALIRASARENGLTVVSVFVNPRQFDDEGDLAGYPREPRGDLELATQAGAGLCFFPTAESIYPPGHPVQQAPRGPLTESLEGAVRGPGHFDGVCTVLNILFGMVRPDTAYFGRKDAQQLRVVARMAQERYPGLRIEPVDTVRDPDGLALSSRNARLDRAGRRAATALYDALVDVGRALSAGELATGAQASEMGMERLAAGGTEPEYFVAAEPAGLTGEPAPGPATLLLCAARAGNVRLIDNMTVAQAARAAACRAGKEA